MTAGITPGDDEQPDARRDECPPDERDAARRQVGAEDDGEDPDDERQAAAPAPAVLHLGGSLLEPALRDAVVLHTPLKARDVLAELDDLLRLDVVRAAADRLEVAVQEARALVHRPPARPDDPCLLLRVGDHGVRRVDADLLARREQALLVLRLERDQAADREVEAGGRQGAAADLPVAHRGACRGREAGRRGGDVDRRVVEVDRVAAGPEPLQHRPRHDHDEQQRGDDHAEQRVRLAEERDRGGVLGRRVGVDLGHRDGRGAVEVAAAEEREHVLVEDLLALLVGQVRGAVAGPGIQLDLAVARIALVEVEQDHEPVVDPRAADAPLVHEGDRVRLGLLGRDPRRDELGVDDDLRAGPALDPVDRLLELLDRGVAEHVRLVVDRLVGDRVGERRAGRRDRREHRQQEGEPDDERDGERRATGEPGVTDGRSHPCTIRNPAPGR